MTKIYCPGCDQEKGDSDFAHRNIRKGIRQVWCRACQAKANQKHYQNNKQLYITRALNRSRMIINENQKKLIEYLSTHPCVDCGNSDIRVLEFDHVQGEKSCNVTHMVVGAIYWAIIEKEIEKCEVRCVNCHRIKTNKQYGWWRALLSTTNE